jgi:hypothetical protein
MLTSGGAQACKTDGGDLRFYTTSALTTQLPHDVITLTQNTTPANAKVEIVVKTNLSSSTSTIIYVAWGDSALSLQARNSTYGQDNAYESGFKLWCPMKDGTTSNVIDRTVNQNTGTKRSAGNPPTVTSGQVNEAVDFASVNGDYVLHSAIAQGTTFTWMCGFQPHNVTDNEMVDTWRDGFGLANGYTIAIAPTLVVVGGGSTLVDFSEFTYVNNNWYALAVQFTGTSVGFIKDGAVKSATRTIEAAGNGVYQKHGNRDWSPAPYDGIMDNVIIYSGSLADATVRTMQNNQRAVNTFSSYGSVVSLAASTVTLTERRVFEGVLRGVMRGTI